MNQFRRQHTATRLSNGKVIVAGGVPFAQAATSELDDPVTQIWTNSGALNIGREFHSATLPADGQVMVTGGQTANQLLAQTEVYDPSSGRWIGAGSLNDARELHTATLLASGLVLVTGGFPDIASTELLDPTTGQWDLRLPLNVPRYQHTATPRLRSGIVPGRSPSLTTRSATGALRPSPTLNFFKEFVNAAGMGRASNARGDRRVGPATDRRRILAVTLVTELLPGFASLDLLAQAFCDLQPDGFQRMVAGGGVDVRAGHGQMHVRPECGRVVPLAFQHHVGHADGNQAVQAFELLPQPKTQAGVGVEATNSELDFHNARCR